MGGVLSQVRQRNDASEFCLDLRWWSSTRMLALNKTPASGCSFLVTTFRPQSSLTAAVLPISRDAAIILHPTP
jgi:hypothetical protein